MNWKVQTWVTYMYARITFVNDKLPDSSNKKYSRGSRECIVVDVAVATWSSPYEVYSTVPASP